jgi:hypothetical protein
MKGFGGTRATNVKMGAPQCEWLDAESEECKFLVPKSHHAPDGKVRLLSPHHWGQAMTKGNKPASGTGSKKVHNKATLFWNQRKNKLHFL